MRSFGIFLGLIAVGLLGIAVLAWPAWELTQALGLDFKFHRVASRIAMLTLLAGFVLVARRLKVADRVSLGFGAPRAQFLKSMGGGLALGAVTMLPVLATMVLLDMRELRPDFAPTVGHWVTLAVTGLVTGLVVALIEETFLRGAMMTAISRESGMTAAIVLTSLVYAATHFIGKYRVAPGDVDWTSGLDMLAGTFSAFANFGGIVDAFLCLAGVGVLLGLVRARTGNIAACIGLHAGWVMVIYVVRETSMRNPTGPATWLLSDYDGFIGWMVLAWIVVLGFLLARVYRR
ncbi:MAG TPA: CPBP family intramembrane glutamic endopeptidase [Steroidobacteraceae bacterium]|nr:CPBP family intramembrane glutamic endopeptidase [Steroidobacteraceae bacterium]